MKTRVLTHMKAGGTTSDSVLFLLTGTTVLASIGPPFVTALSLLSVFFPALALLYLCTCLVLAGLVKKQISFLFAFYPLP